MVESLYLLPIVYSAMYEHHGHNTLVNTIRIAGTWQDKANAIDKVVNHHWTDDWGFIVCLDKNDCNIVRLIFA